MKGDVLNIQITARSIFLVFLFLIIAWLLYEIRDVVLVIISAVIFSLALAPGKRFFARFKIPEPLAVVILYVLVFSILSFFLYSLVPILVQQYQIFIETLPRIIEVMREVAQGTIFENLLAQEQFSRAFSNPQHLPQTIEALFKATGTSLSSLFGGLINIILFFLLTFLFAVSPKSLDEFLYVMTPKRYRKYTEDLWKRTQAKMSQWFQGQMLLVFIIGVLTYLALTILGVPNALFLAAFAGAMEIIPIFGPVIGAIPAILMAITTGDFTLVVLVILVFIVIQQLENNLIYPLVVSKVVGISSVMIILATVIGGSIAGFVGVIIAVPLAGVIQEFFHDVKSGKLQKFQEFEGV